MNKVQSSKFKVQNLVITALVVIFIFMVGLNVVYIVNAQAPDRDIPAGDNGTLPTATPTTRNSTGNVSPTSVDITKSSFKLLICDGPEELRHYNPATNKIEPGYVDKVNNISVPPYENPDFIPCDFRGLMMQLQHFINIAMVLGVLVALGGLLWAGALYISGAPEKIKQAHKIFPSIFWGFIIMLSAWFIVYQILEWLTGPNAKSFGVLLGL